MVNPVVNLVARVSYLAAPSLAPGSGKMIDPGNEVAGSTMINVTERNEFIKQGRVVQSPIKLTQG